MRLKHYLILLALSLPAVKLSAQSIKVTEQGKPSSIRGLSVIDDRVAWASGSRGHVAITKDGGKTWAWQQVKGFEQSDFRDIEAFSDQEAIIMSSGTPAVILKTTDGGANWQTCYRNDKEAYFLDAMDFDNKKHGFILGDPINGKFLLLETKDAGKTWAEVTQAPAALPDEAAFAASGTCMRIYKGTIAVVTGGSKSHYFTADVNHLNWVSLNLPVAQNAGSKGAFSTATNGTTTIVTGGNYEKHLNTDSVACYFNAKVKRAVPAVTLAAKQPEGYQSCVEALNKNTFLSTGTPGTNITADGGKTWNKVDNTSFNVCRKAKKGKLVLLAGDRGKIAIFNVSD
jgi:photosystem II stability/assembly factor-like uncharacterized protein